ncbi:MAG: TatD family hydrolase [Lysobacterales bacterium]|nr:TatD family hydrolase [Xanthomonadales bacterium]MCB1612989.1 TatD family hydrolase [Xanthomonadales bacterium]
MLIDSHCHLDAPEFDADRAAVLARARAAGVIAQIIPAVTAASFEPLAALTSAEADLHAAYGLHPMFLAEHVPEHLAAVRERLADGAAVAVGECGLDFFVEGLDPDLQRAYFVAQVELAREFQLPLVLHARRSVEEVIATLRRVGGVSGVVHSYSGSEEQARQLWKMGFCLGVGGPVTFERAQRLRRLVATMPIEFLLLETDAPDQPDQWHRGQRNEPAHLPATAATIAQLRGVSAEEIAQATSANARRVFGLV